MAFRNYVYESDSGVSFQVRLDSDQETIAGAVAGISDVAAHVRVSTSRRQFGIQPRHIIAKRLVGTAPVQVVRTTRVPMCTVAAYSAFSVGSSVTVNGIAYTVSGKVPEVSR